MSETGSASPDTDEAVQQEQTPGTLLRKLREEAGLSYAAVGEALHLTVHYVKALESDAYDKLPALTFVKGYVRSYARFMHADVDAVLAGFETYVAGLVVEGRRTEQVRRTRRRHDQALRWAIATSVILVLGIAGGWWFKGKDDSAATSNRAPQQVVQGSARNAATVSPMAGISPEASPAAAPVMASPMSVPAVSASSAFSPASSSVIAVSPVLSGIAVSPVLSGEVAAARPEQLPAAGQQGGEL